MYRRHDFEEKLNIVTKIQNRIPLDRVASEYNIDDKMVHKWLRKYELQGESGLLKQRNIKETNEIKQDAVLLFLDKNLPLSEIVLQYGVSRFQLKNWIELFNKGLLAQTERRERPRKDMGRLKKQESISEIERLQAENARLKAELALLKKSEP